MRNSNPPLNPIIAAITGGGPGGVVELLGFVGAGPDGFLRVYRALDMSNYVDVPADDVIHFVQAEREIEPTRIFIRSTSRVTVTERRVAAVEARELALGRTSDRSGKARAETECFRTCAYNFRDCLRGTDGDYDLCSWILDECNARCEDWFPLTARYGRSSCGCRSRFG